VTDVTLRVVESPK